MAELEKWFAKGLTQEEYIRSMEQHKENLLVVYNSFYLEEDERVYLQTLQSEGLRAVVLTADWCGDAMVNLPIFMRMAQESCLEARYLIRDENLELMDQYLTNGRARSIPIIVFFNQQGDEIAKWGPRAQQVEAIVGEMKKNLPPKESPEFEAAFKQFAGEISSRFTTDQSIWDAVKDSLMESLKNRVQQ
ncbi:thioredoxin family protein [Metabacillus sp. GX 13764]|uniref:thioredoxin family protein n=1 Tax=Metabacillus kandeliae TaxID=2900151 RepID=UPI001E636263|nr:thioredoxin family protein [Metabacillus kandeliae]MCD7036498.1 thioredoxin family protein [Metabacillus kandeliae]